MLLHEEDTRNWGSAKGGREKKKVAERQQMQQRKKKSKKFVNKEPQNKLTQSKGLRIDDRTVL